jgi:hypothetical protein
MSGDFILRHRVDRDFTVLPNRVLRDTRLRWSDRGLLAFLLHLPGNFKLNYVFLAKQAPDGVDAVSSCVRRLCSLRYVQIERERDASGRYVRVIWTVTDRPEPEPDFPNVAGADAARPSMANRQLTSTSVQQERSATTTTTALAEAPVVVTGLDSPPLSAYREAAMKALATCPPDLRQAVVDETLGAAEAKAIRKNAGAYLRALCAAARRGEFVPQAGVSIEVARRRHKEDLERRAADEAQRQERDTPEARERGRRALEEVRSKLGLLRPRPSPSPSVVANSRPPNSGAGR